MGRHFGHLGYVRGIISHSLSPFEQRAFAGVISKGIPNMWRRVREQIFRVVPPFIGAYLIIDWGDKAFEQAKRKTPTDFVNDK
ncbi:cytochrome b-c1 complex subunit 8-like [Gigantopelta aegis]|uniref:cytochrome b-c1 complex subunit 8-like n=1 Tax=Gigantopelta aegis TaxID=1735272 RepID=UPI001B88DD24|nr:cytochrome b-c1 complex subunit 8-like [Gigantopelta aegis]XP_041358479.1 cytochrome b-c1 complex subunit 8-like [Gigantopelta aegis]